MRQYTQKPFTWLENHTGESTAFTMLGLFICMRAVHNGWYWMHLGQKSDLFFNTRDKAEADAEAFGQKKIKEVLDSHLDFTDTQII